MGDGMGVGSLSLLEVPSVSIFFTHMNQNIFWSNSSYHCMSPGVQSKKRMFNKYALVSYSLRSPPYTRYYRMLKSIKMSPIPRVLQSSGRSEKSKFTNAYKHSLVIGESRMKSRKNTERVLSLFFISLGSIQ
jgi:hypothetical protein